MAVGTHLLAVHTTASANQGTSLADSAAVNSSGVRGVLVQANTHGRVAVGSPRLSRSTSLTTTMQSAP